MEYWTPLVATPFPFPCASAEQAPHVSSMPAERIIICYPRAYGSRKVVPPFTGAPPPVKGGTTFPLPTPAGNILLFFPRTSSSQEAGTSWRVQEPSDRGAKLLGQEVTYSQPPASSGRRRYRKEDAAASCCLSRTELKLLAAIVAASCSSTRGRLCLPLEPPPNRRAAEAALLHWLFSPA